MQENIILLMLKINVKVCSLLASVMRSRHISTDVYTFYYMVGSFQNFNHFLVGQSGEVSRFTSGFVSFVDLSLDIRARQCRDRTTVQNLFPTPSFPLCLRSPFLRSNSLFDNKFSQ